MRSLKKNKKSHCSYFVQDKNGLFEINFSSPYKVWMGRFLLAAWQYIKEKVWGQTFKYVRN